MSVVLITGSGSGFGEAIAVGFAQQGYQVVATMRRPDRAPAALKTLAAERPSDVVITALDVCDPQARRRAMDLTLEKFGRLDILVNCAGVGATGALEDVPESVLRKVLDTNFFGPLELMRLVLPVMRKQGAGRIINITSVASLFSTPFMSAYTASKQALDAASVAADIESRSFGVRVAAIVAGPFKTGLPAKSVDIGPSAAYATTHGNYKSFFSKLEGHAAVDLSPVVKTVMAAATDADPPLRYLVGAEGITFLPNLLQALAPEQFFALLATGQQK